MKKTLFFVFLLSIIFSGCQTICEDKLESFNKLIPPIVVIKKDIEIFGRGFYIVVQDKKGYQLAVLQYKNCTFSDTLVNKYNLGDTIK